jgi:hypothetical protein
MPNAWGGADPIEAVDADDYELGVEYQANSDITITHVRIWSGAGEENITNRRARIWSTTGSQQALITLPDDLSTGWSSHALDTPLEKTAGSKFVVSYMTGGNYGFLNNALDSDVPSGDGNVTALAASNATNGNGVFNLTPGSFPATGPGTHPFYGVDFTYTVGIGGNTAPRITELTSVESGATATVTAVVADDETLTGATLRFKWGDGGSDTVVTYPTASAQHTYSASGFYAVLVTLTDASGAADHEAVVAEIHVPDAGIIALDFPAIRDALVSHAEATGRFTAVTKHEPFSKPAGVHAAIWLDTLTPVERASGLAGVAVRLAFVCRVYLGAESKPYDDVDAKGLAAADRLMAAWAGDFTLNGRIRNVDLKGAHGVPLSAQSGYQRIGDTTYRVITLTVPLIVNDVWEEVA